MDTIHLKGTLHLCAYDRMGVKLWEDIGHNLIVTGGYKAAANALAGVEGGRIAQVAVGTSGIAPSEADTMITDAVVLNITNIEYPKNGTVRFNFTIGYKDANYMPIREFGLITADGRLFSRKVRESLEKTEDMTISGMWDINF